jgi:hypothetical protein
MGNIAVVVERGSKAPRAGGHILILYRIVRESGIEALGPNDTTKCDMAEGYRLLLILPDPKRTNTENAI